jgi:hypothetical protein
LPLKPVDRALEMLFLQAYKAHFSVSVLAEHGQIEDAATIARRLLELAVQATYIADDDEATRTTRASAYVSFLWEELPASLKEKLPAASRRDWESICIASPSGGKTRVRWGPSFRKMFEAIGREDTYAGDYRLLSGIAHGSVDELVWHYSMPTVTVRPHHHIPVVLVIASLYFLAVAHAHNPFAKVLDDGVVETLVERTNAWIEKWNTNLNAAEGPKPPMV